MQSDNDNDTRPPLSEIKCKQDGLKIISNWVITIPINTHVSHNFYGKSKVWNNKK